MPMSEEQQKNIAISTVNQWETLQNSLLLMFFPSPIPKTCLCQVCLQESRICNNVWQTLAVSLLGRDCHDSCCTSVNLIYLWDHIACITFCPGISSACLSILHFLKASGNTGHTEAYSNKWRKPYFSCPTIITEEHAWHVKLIVKNTMLEVWILFPNTKVSKWIRAFSATGWSATGFIQGPSFFSGLGMFFAKFFSTSVQFIGMPASCQIHFKAMLKEMLSSCRESLSLCLEIWILQWFRTSSWQAVSHSVQAGSFRFRGSQNILTLIHLYSYCPHPRWLAH